MRGYLIMCLCVSYWLSQTAVQSWQMTMLNRNLILAFEQQAKLWRQIQTLQEMMGDHYTVSPQFKNT